MKKVVPLLLALMMIGPMLFASGTKDVAPKTSAAPTKGVDQVYYEAFPPGGQGQSSFITTTAHRLDTYVNEPGVAITWQGGLKNLLVEEYEMLEDGKVWILHLNKNATWHDGKAVIPEDFIWSYSAWANPRISTRWNGKAQSIVGYADVQAGKTDTLSGVKKVDEHTVRVELSSPMPLWMKLEQTYLVVFPYHIFKDVAIADVVGHSYWKNRIGTGPFKWAEYKPDQYIHLVRNDNYYDGPAILTDIWLAIYQDAASMLNAYAAGSIDTVYYEGNTITPQERDYYGSLPGKTVVTMDKGSGSAIILNFKDKDWAKKEVRQALMYALDINSILDNLYPGALVSRTIFPQKWAWGDGLNEYAYNPQKAKQLLTSAGFSGKTHRLYYTQTDALTQNLLVACQQYWAAVGVNVELVKVDAGATQEIHAKDPDMFLNGTGVGLDPTLAETGLKTGELLAYGYSNARVDELFDYGRTLVDQKDREPVYQEISAIINEEVPRVWLWYDIRDLGFSDRVVGPAEHWAEQGTIQFNMGVYNEVTKWYIK